jgi:hypothetical protein
MPRYTFDEVKIALRQHCDGIDEIPPDPRHSIGALDVEDQAKDGSAQA